MDVVSSWTGARAHALQQALRMTNEAFAEHLGAAVRTVTYWQALGLVVLSWILFRGFRGPRFSGGHWKDRLRERWRNMTPEQREEFVKGVRTRWHDLRERWESMTPEAREEFVKGGRSQWNEMRELWDKMTPEERDELIQGARSRAAARGSAAGEPGA